jgi:NADH:ubiquinone reductase (H+-translocating)
MFDGNMKKKRVLILGGGYAGLAVAQGLARYTRERGLKVTLVDSSAWHTVKTRFHEVAVNPARSVLVRLPLSSLVPAYGARFIRESVDYINYDERCVRIIKDSTEKNLEYDRIVVSLGAETNYFGVPGAEEYAPSL